jgi:hypothetical protein
MSTQWNVTQGDNQFVVTGGLAELKNMARRGDLGPGDMIQPPGAADWMYASEIPELQVIFSKHKEVDDDAEAANGPNYLLMGIGGALALLFLGVVVIGGGVALYFASQMTETPGALIGEGGLSYSQMIVTSAGTGLRAEPSDGGSIKTPVAKDEVLELLAKRSSFYKARTKGGAEGWIPINQVLPMYQLGGNEVKDEFDPLYNPDRYVEVSNARWMQLPPEKGKPEQESNTTVFLLAISNSSQYAMTDLRLVVTIKDAQGHELEKVEVAVEGEIPPLTDTMVGSLLPEEDAKARGKGKKKAPDAAPARILTTATYEEMASTEPELALRWMDGFEVEMATQEVMNAKLDVVELRAVPAELPKKSGKHKGG